MAAKKVIANERTEIARKTYQVFTDFFGCFDIQRGILAEKLLAQCSRTEFCITLVIDQRDRNQLVAVAKSKLENVYGTFVE